MSGAMRRGGVLGALVLAAVLVSAAPAGAQAGCQGEYAPSVAACMLGAPDADGITARVALAAPGDARAYRFTVAEPSTAYLYVGDLWHDLAAELWREPPAGAQPRERVASVQVAERRVLQFVRPAMIVERLEPGQYWVVVRAGGEPPASMRDFTLRVALGPPACAVQRDSSDLYLLALSQSPAAADPFTLLSFSAVVSPPYSDLFDFEWQVDGQPAASGRDAVLQVAAEDLPAGEHRVRVTARGVRPYPDPDPQYRHLPPTLSAECTFRVAAAE